MKIIKDSVYTFSANNAPVEKVEPGELLQFQTQDCFGGQITSEDQLVHELDLTKANPAAGPVYFYGAEPGDVLVVEILRIRVDVVGFACSIGETGPLASSSEVRTKVIPIKHGQAQFNDVQWNIKPMIGVIGTAPAEGEMACGFAGDHGGNMDSKLIREGTKVYLPVRVPGGLLQIGDLHASMGDGEICGTGIEIGGEVIVSVNLIKNFELNWPVTETARGWYVNTTAPGYEEALEYAALELSRLMKPAYRWDETDNFIYFSLHGNVGVNQGCFPCHTPMFTLRLGIPKMAGKPSLL